jgi:hypothetical protein
MKYCMLFLVLISTHSFGNEYLDAIEKYESKYELPRGTLYTISSLESGHHPWTININGIPAYLKSQEQLIHVIREINDKPYYFKSNDGFHNFYKSIIEAEIAATTLKMPLSTIQKLNLMSTDICGTQLNYYWNESAFSDVIEMTNIDKCLNRSAQLLKLYISKHGFSKGVACYHNCNTKSKAHKRYKKKFIQAYSKQFSEYYPSLVRR